MTHKILVIDDEADIRNVLADIIQDEGYYVFTAAHSEQALALVEKRKTRSDYSRYLAGK